MIDVSSSVKGYGPVRDEAFRKFKKRIHGVEVKKVRFFRNLFKFSNRKSIVASKIKQKDRDINR